MYPIADCTETLKYRSCAWGNCTRKTFQSDCESSNATIIIIVILITYEWHELSLQVSCELLCAFQVRTALHKFRGHFDFSKLYLKITRSSSCAGDVQMRVGPCFQEVRAASLIGDIATTRRRLHSWYTSPRSDCAPCNSRLRLAPAIVTRADASSSSVASASLMAREPGPS